MTELKNLKKKLLKDPDVRTEYEVRQGEFAIVLALIAARKRDGLTQEQVAERMGTVQPVIARVESGRQRPSLKTIERYAKATGHRAVVSLEPASSSTG